MTRYLYNVLAVTIALGTIGAQIVCGCPDLLSIGRAARPQASTCVGERDCCRKVEPQRTSPPQQQEPCDKCNLKHRTQQALPDSQSTNSIPQLALHAFPAALETISATELVVAQPRLADGVPPPLDDLFHAHSLLLI